MERLDLKILVVTPKEVKDIMVMTRLLQEVKSATDFLNGFGGRMAEWTTPNGRFRNSSFMELNLGRDESSRKILQNRSCWWELDNII